ncbi:hypothetical protein OPS25_07940 [Alteromonas ponticola]|uniref:Exonuclease III n=1 Tax=Alteromonas aquimaris TaxID=2998417 RepID=A0ABT3P6N0_9ALTE|nr:hypothetical protein [Alteromonas aquimaris]MCW8108422.1 hypothetical protein [Alteromonas aquimaris]
MKAILAVALLAGSSLSFSSLASEKVNLFLKDKSLESRVCLTAAAQGLDAAAQIISESGKSFKRFTRHLECNGLSVTAFADRYSGATVIAQHAFNAAPAKKSVVLVARNNKESKVCADAAVVGVKRAADTHGMNAIQARNIVCNDAPISKFVNEFKKKDVQVSAE